MSQAEIPLNGAYYGPSVPPPQYHGKRRSCPCCVLTTFVKFMIAFIIVIGIAALVFWLVVRPTKLKVHVVSAELNQFDLTNSTTLNYNLSLNMAFRNPNKKIGVYYDKLEATASYEGERFGWATLPKFYQGHKNTTNLNANFQGQSLVVLKTSEVDVFNQEKNSGVFYIDVKIYARIRFKIGSIKSKKIKPEIECELRVPLGSNGTVDTGFQSTKCDIDF